MIVLSLILLMSGASDNEGFLQVREPTEVEIEGEGGSILLYPAQGEPEGPFDLPYSFFLDPGDERTHFRGWEGVYRWEVVRPPSEGHLWMTTKEGEGFLLEIPRDLPGSEVSLSVEPPTPTPPWVEDLGEGPPSSERGLDRLLLSLPLGVVALLLFHWLRPHA